MSPTATPKRTLSTAEERREAVLEAGMSVFAEKGFLGTPTTEVAKAAGISQAYLFRLFPTKTDLVLAVVERSNQRIDGDVRQGRRAGAGHRRRRQGGDGRGLRRAAAGPHDAHDADPPVRGRGVDARGRRGGARAFAKLYDLAGEAAGLGPEELHQFFATGMLLNVMAAIGAEDDHGEWASTLRVC